MPSMVSQPVVSSGFISLLLFRLRTAFVHLDIKLRNTGLCNSKSYPKCGLAHGVGDHERNILRDIKNS